jgi:uncharacterized membrane protein
MTARRHHPSAADVERLETLRRERPAHAPHPSRRRPKRAQRTADRVTALIGSWRFILVQSALLADWIAVNVTAELEIEARHAKLDALREQEILRLMGLVEKLSEKG